MKQRSRGLSRLISIIRYCGLKDKNTLMKYCSGVAAVNLSVLSVISFTYWVTLVILSVTCYSFAKKSIDFAGRAEYFTMAIISFIVFIGTRIIKRKLPEIKGRRIGIEYFRSIYIVFMLAMSFVLDCFVQDNNFYFNTFVVLYTSVGLYVSTLLEEMIIGASIMLMFFIFAFNGLETKLAVLNVFIMLFIIVIQSVASYKNTRDTLVGKAEIDRDILIKNEYYKNISAQQEQIILMVNEFENYKKVLLEHLRNGNIEELKALVKENNDAVSKETNIDYIEHTGNPVFDAIIYDQRVKFRDYNINVDVRCDIGDLMNNKNFELVSLLGNAFSNAMEACTYVEKESDRYVKVRAKTKEGMFYLNMENSFDGYLNKERNKLTGEDKYISRKRNDEGFHGHGIESMTEICRKLNGVLKIDSKDKCFSLSIILPLK